MRRPAWAATKMSLFAAMVGMLCLTTAVVVDGTPSKVMDRPVPLLASQQNSKDHHGASQPHLRLEKPRKVCGCETEDDHSEDADYIWDHNRDGRFPFDDDSDDDCDDRKGDLRNKLGLDCEECDMKEIAKEIGNETHCDKGKKTPRKKPGKKPQRGIK